MAVRPLLGERVPSTRGLLDLADVGVRYQTYEDVQANGLLDQTALVQEAYDRAANASGGVLISGLVAVRPEIDNTANVPTIGRGAGETWYDAASCIRCIGDTPNAKDPMLLHGGPGTGKGILLKDLRLMGPMPDAPVTGETGGVNVYGFNAETRAHIEGVAAHGFACAASSNNDHQIWRDCDLNGNGTASLDFKDRVGLVGIGDMQFDHCFMTANGIASILLADNAVLANANFVGNGHIGLNPVGILRYAADPASNAAVDQALTGVTFQHWSFEYIRYAAMWDRGRNQATWQDVRWNNPSRYGLIAGDYTIGGWPDPDWPDPDELAMFHLGYQALDWRFDHGMPVLPGKKTMSVENHIFGLATDYFRAGDWHDLALSSPLEVRKAYAEHGVEFNGITFGTPGRLCGESVSTVRTAHTTIQRGQVLQEAATNHVEPHDGTRPPVGVAVGDYVQGAPALLTAQSDEELIGIRNTSGSGMAQGAMVKPDPGTAGGCVTTTNAAEAIGYVTNAGGIANGAWGRARIQI